MNRLRSYMAVPIVRNGVWVFVFAALFILGVERFLWAPARAEHLALKDRVIDLQIEKSTYQMRVDAVIAQAETEATLAVLEAKLAAPIDRSGVVEILADLSTQSGTQIIHGANSFGRPRGAVRPVLQDLTVEGSYERIAEFLTRLNQVETLTLLRRAEFSTNPDGSLVRVQLNLMTLNTGSIQ